MGGGGTQKTSTKAQLPPELAKLFGGTASEISDVFDERSLSDVFGVAPRQVAGPAGLERAAAENVGAFFDPTASGTAAFDTASQLVRPERYGGTDISGLGSFRDFAGEASRPSLAREALPGREESALMNMDFANHPALKSAMKSFEAAALPGLANQLGAAGLSRSGAAGSAITSAKAQMAMPMIQQLMSGAVTERGQDIGQRQQDIGAGITQRGQDIQDIGSKLNLALGARGQDVQALLGKGAQDLQGRGQDIQSMVAGMGGLQGLNDADLRRLQAGMDAAMGVGGTMRGIEQDALNALYDADIRDSDLLAQIGLAPLGGLTSAIGSTTTTSGGK
ncbi:MAG: hypothetical protein ACYSWO_25210 [Planctomycetota bacterium]|jgi:hypothetical protein